MIEEIKYYFTSMHEKGYAVFSLWFTVFAELFGKYIFNDPEFIKFLFVLVCADTIFGVWKTVKFGGLRALSFSAAQGFISKLFLYFGVLVLCHSVVSFTVHGKPNNYFTWIDSVLYSYMVGKEALSVARNINGISPSMVPTFLIDRLNNFLKSGKASDLINDKPQEPENDNH